MNYPDSEFIIGELVYNKLSSKIMIVQDITLNMLLPNGKYLGDSKYIYGLGGGTYLYAICLEKVEQPSPLIAGAEEYDLYMEFADAHHV